MDTILILVSIIGNTQIIKDAGVKGQVLKVVAVVLGGAMTYLAIYYPDIWEQVRILVASLGATGAVSFVDERIKNSV